MSSKTSVALVHRTNITQLQGISSAVPSSTQPPASDPQKSLTPRAQHNMRVSSLLRFDHQLPPSAPVVRRGATTFGIALPYQQADKRQILGETALALDLSDHATPPSRRTSRSSSVETRPFLSSPAPRQPTSHNLVGRTDSQQGVQVETAINNTNNNQVNTASQETAAYFAKLRADPNRRFVGFTASRSRTPSTRATTTARPSGASGTPTTKSSTAFSGASWPAKTCP